MRAAALILAAGAGSRLGGQAKAALRVADGRTFLQAITDTARAAGCTRLVVVTAALHEAATRAAGAVDDVVLNPEPARGMASSFAAGLAALGASVDVALLWPVDHPLVLPGSVRAVLAAAARDAIVIPCHAGRGGHPTAFGAELFAACAAAAASTGPGGLRALYALEPGRVRRLTLDDAGVVDDVDTPADYDRIKG